MNTVRIAALLGGAALLAGCPQLFLPPNASPGEAPTKGDVASAPGTAYAGPLGGHYRVKLFGRTKTREFDLNLDQAGPYVFGRLAPLNHDPIPGWAADGMYTVTQSGAATMSIVFTIGTATASETATTSIEINAAFVMTDLSLASPAPSPLPTPTPFPTAPPRDAGGSIAMPAPAKPPIGSGTFAQGFVGTWSEDGQATGSVTAIKFSPR